MNNHHNSTPPQQRHVHAATGHHPVLHPPFISNSLAIRQEIQRFESVHPSIYAIYDLIDLLPDAQIAQQIRDHVVCIEDPESHGWILNGEGKKAIQNVLDTMPCGWPDAGIPPLAPYRQEEMIINLKKSFVDTLTELIRFRIDGLDQMIINKLKISYTFSKKVKYNFTFPRIKISGKYISDTFMNLMQEYGISVRYDTDGTFEINLDNLTLDGQFKYKMPWIFGSIKIYKFKILVTLGNAEVNFTNLLGNGLFNRLLTEKVEESILWAINGNQAEVSRRIEEVVVPTVNDKLKGHKIWSVIFGGSSSTCVPPPDPWA